MFDDEFDVVLIEESVCRQMVGQVIDLNDKQCLTYDRALGDTTYDLSRL